MASNDDTKKETKKGMPTWATALIVIVILAVIAVTGYYFYTKKGSANAVRNIGTPAPTGNAAVASMPSPMNVSAGNGNAAAGRVGAQV